MRGPLFWLKAARAPFFTGSLAPIAVGTALAYAQTGGLHWPRALLALVALTALQACANLANDYFDHLSGNDAANTSFARPFTGGSRVIQDGLVRPEEMLLAAGLCLGLAGLLGLYLTWVGGWPILLLGAVGGVTGVLYTAPPFKFVYRGFGELFIFLDFGLLPVLGAYYLQTGHFSLAAAVVSLPTALLITGVLWINQFQDREADAAVGKRHWVVRLGRWRAAWVHVVLLTSSQLITPLAALAGLLPGGAALSLLGAPLALRAGITAVAAHDDLPRLTPANAATIGCHLVTSLALSLGLVLSRRI